MTPELKFPEFIIQLPGWIEPHLAGMPGRFFDVESKMRFVIDLANHNIRHHTGGPFAAAVFDEYGDLVAPGVNIVIPANCSVLHAEMMAIMMAQKILGRYDLSAGGTLTYELYASTEPCAMCFGAIPWSGVRKLVCGARSEDAQKIGFDEGPRLSDWTKALNDRSIAVVRDVLRKEASAVLNEYRASGGIIYNPGLNKL